jgi:hypothetical protein
MGNTTDKIAGVANQAAGKVKGGGVVSSARLTSVHFILNGSGRRSRPIPGRRNLARSSGCGVA